MLKSIPDAQPDLTTDLAKSANALGFEIVDIAGFFERLEQLCDVQKQSAGALNSASRTLTGATDTIVSGCRTMSASTDAANDAATKTLEGVRASDASARKVATWVHELSDRSTSIHAALGVVKSHNALIAGIARQVNMLAINAKIEAARAGELGRGFSVVANAINELSQQTGKAAVQIADGVENLAGWVEELAQDSQTIGDEAENVLSKASENQANFSQLAASLSSNLEQVTSITNDVERMRGAVEQLLPAVRSIDDSVEETSDGISGATKRTARLVDISETLVQQAAAAG
ncbi:MAG: methyl-accepting chemotaxis protein, partial [Pseudomonadota bacterium]